MLASYSNVASFALATWLVACGSSPPAARAAKGVSDQTKALIQTAQDHEKRRRYDLAKTAYQRAIDEAPNQASGGFAARKMASALLFWGEYAGAETALKTAVKLRPTDVSAWHDLGIVRNQLGNPAGAETAFRRSISLQPEIPLSRLALAALLVNARRFEEALAQYEALLALELPERYREAIQKARRMIRDEMHSGE